MPVLTATSAADIFQIIHRPTGPVLLSYVLNRLGVTRATKRIDNIIRQIRLLSLYTIGSSPHW